MKCQNCGKEFPKEKLGFIETKRYCTRCFNKIKWINKHPKTIEREKKILKKRLDNISKSERINKQERKRAILLSKEPYLVQKVVSCFLCLKCGHEWIPNKNKYANKKFPQRCPNCKAMDWFNSID